VIVVGGPAFTYSDEPSFGGRLTVGSWADPCHSIGFEVSGLYLSPSTSNFTDGIGPNEAFGNMLSYLPTRLLIDESTTPAGDRNNTVRLHTSTESCGVEANVRCRFEGACGTRVDLLGGFRYLQMEDEFELTGDSFGFAFLPVSGFSFLGVPRPDAVREVIVDRFETRNQFYGPQIGLEAGWHCGCFSVDLRGKLGVGYLRQRTTIAGSTTLFLANGGSEVASGGVLAQASNIGTYEHSHFGILPELGVNVSYDWCDGVRLFAGYTLIYWPEVLRAAGQIDTNVDSAQAPAGGLNVIGETGPSYPEKHNSFWLQGVNLGLEFSF
jgi:hypothetical protein